MKQIIAFGGGGFSMDDTPLLDQYILSQSLSREPKICFIPTASGDSEGYIDGFYRAFSSFSCVPTHMALSRLSSFKDTDSFIMEQDILYVGGGDTELLLQVWRDTGFDVSLRRAWESGVILAGLSAGSICWFDEGVTDTTDHDFQKIEGLRLLTGSHCPHYDSEEGFRATYLELIRQGDLMEGIATDDGVALHYIGSELTRVVSSRPNAFAYRVRRNEDGDAEQQVVYPEYLGKL